MNNFKFEAIEGEPVPEDKEVMVKGMLAHHAMSGHERKSYSHTIMVRDDQSKLAGMVMVTFLWNGMEIGTLWVDDSKRGQGLGRKLMEIAEQEGIKRGCTVAYTNTFPWQAPGFYEKLGYTLFGKIEDFPKDSYLSYYSKKLI